jgi:hypothetical protein
MAIEANSALVTMIDKSACSAARQAEIVVEPPSEACTAKELSSMIAIWSCELTHSPDYLNIA